MKPFPLILQQMLDNADRLAPEASHQHGLADALREAKQTWEDYEAQSEEYEKLQSELDDSEGCVSDLNDQVRDLEKQITELEEELESTK